MNDSREHWARETCSSSLQPSRVGQCWLNLFTQLQPRQWSGALGASLSGRGGLLFSRSLGIAGDEKRAYSDGDRMPEVERVGEEDTAWESPHPCNEVHTRGTLSVVNQLHYTLPHRMGKWGNGQRNCKFTSPCCSHLRVERHFSVPCMGLQSATRWTSWVLLLRINLMVPLVLPFRQEML